MNYRAFLHPTRRASILQISDRFYTPPFERRLRALDTLTLHNGCWNEVALMISISKPKGCTGVRLIKMKVAPSHRIYTWQYLACRKLSPVKKNAPWRLKSLVRRPQATTQGKKIDIMASKRPVLGHGAMASRSFYSMGRGQSHLSFFFSAA